MLWPAPAAKIVNENPAHRLRGGGKEMASAVPTGCRTIADQPQVGLVDQRSRVTLLRRPLPHHVRCRQLAQFLVDDRQQPLGRAFLAAFNLAEDLSQLVQVSSPEMGGAARDVPRATVPRGTQNPS